LPAPQSTLITRLHTDLLSIRQAYLSTAAPRKTHLRSRSQTSHSTTTPQHLTDRDREEIDANAKSTLRDLNASIRALSDAEQLRRETASALLQKKYASRFGVSWASGGGLAAAAKSPAQVAEEDAAGQMAAHREAVLWFLRQRLGEVGRTQAGMMETRLTREMEKNRSVLAKARGGMVGVNDFPSMGGEVGESSAKGRRQSVRGGLPPGEDERQGSQPQYDLTEEQRQMFEKGNQDMLKHYESTLDKVRYEPAAEPIEGHALMGITGRPKSHWWKYRSYRRCWSTTSLRSRPTSTNWWQTRSTRLRM
jgi:syntaxin 18